MKDIHEVSKLSGLPPSAIRYYEEKRMIRSEGRRGLRRLFHEDVLQKLSWIALGQDAGFSLDEIAEMFSAEGVLKISRKKLRDKAEEIDLRIKKLSAVRDGLQHAAECSAPHHLECPTFQRLVKISAQRSARKRKREFRRSKPKRSSVR